MCLAASLASVLHWKNLSVLGQLCQGLAGPAPSFCWGPGGALCTHGLVSLSDPEALNAAAPSSEEWGEGLSRVSLSQLSRMLTDSGG
jgi:hypothetical protein